MRLDTFKTLWGHIEGGGSYATAAEQAVAAGFAGLEATPPATCRC